MRDMDELFDIFCSDDDQQRRQLEKQHLLRMTDKNFEFYSDQKGPRLKCFNIVETVTTSDVKFVERALGQQKLLNSSLPSVNVGAGASISAQTSDYDASQSLS